MARFEGKEKDAQSARATRMHFEGSDRHKCSVTGMKFPNLLDRALPTMQSSGVKRVASRGKAED